MKTAPTLHDLAADPLGVKQLRAEDRQQLVRDCLCVLVSALALAGDGGPPMRGHGLPEDRLLSTAEVAALIGMSPSWVEKHTSELPTRRRVGSAPRWLHSEILRWIRSRPRYGEAP